MAPVIWGFDLGEMKWSALSTREMFSRRWHLRRERFVIYQLAMLVCLAAECTATYSLAKYTKLQDNIEGDRSGHRATLHNHDLLGAACATIIFCVFVATIFGADFFFLLFFPRRRYPFWYNFTKKVLATLVTAGVLSAAIASNIIVAKHSAFITGVSDEEAQALTQYYFRPPLEYKKWGVNVAWVAQLWVGFAFTLLSLIVMFIAVDYDEHYGPEERDRIEQPMTTVVNNPPRDAEWKSGSRA